MKISKYITGLRALQFFQIFRFGILLLISVFLAKSHLKVSEIGVYELFILIAGSVSFFWISSMLQSLLAMYSNNVTFANDNYKSKNPVFFNIFVLFTALSLLSALCVYIGQPLIVVFLNLSNNAIPYLKILILYIIVSGPVNLIEYIYLLIDKPKKIIIYAVSTFLLQLFSVVLPIYFFNDLAYGLYGLLFINCIRFVWLVIIVYKYSVIKFSKSFIFEFIKVSSPLIVSFLIAGSVQYFSSFLISYKFDEASFAIFRYGAKEFPIIILLINTFGNALTTRFANNDDISFALSDLKKGTTKLMHLLFPIGILLMVSSKLLFPIIFNPNFAASANVFNIFMLIMIFRFLFMRTILIGKNDTKPIFISSIIELVVNIVLSLLFVNIWGIEGVAMATVISNAVERFVLANHLNKKYNIKLRDCIDLKIYNLYSLILIASFVLSCFL